MSNIEKLEKRLQNVLLEKNFYEAHQICRTIYYRLLEAKKNNDLLKFLYTHEYASALDLAELYSDTLQKNKTNVQEDILNQAIDMYSKLFSYSKSMSSDDNPKGVKTDSDCRKNFLNKLINWSTMVAKTNSSKLYGNPKLHLKLARLYVIEDNFEAARTHYFVSEEPEEFAEFLILFYKKQSTKEKIEKETLIAQAVLQCLFFKKIKDSVFLFQHYVEHHPDIGYKRPYRLPLLNFIWIVLRSIYSKNLSDFTLAIDAYKDVIHALDPKLFGCLERVGQIYFQLPTQASSSGFLANIFKGLLGTNPASKEIEEKIEEELDWEDAGDTHEFLTEPLPSELLSETQQDPPKNNQASQGNSASKDGSEMDLD